MSSKRSSQQNPWVAALLIVFLVSHAAPASANQTDPVRSSDEETSLTLSGDPAAPAPTAEETAAAKVESVLELEAAIQAEQDFLLSLISRESAVDADGFREIETLRESAKRLPALQRELATARRASAPRGWRPEPE